MNLKKILKTIKLHEQEISMVLGVLILIVAGILVVRYIKNLKNQSEVSNQAASTQNTNQDEVHTVTKGETLWSISENYYKTGYDWKKIAEANKVDNPSKLEVGTKLTIPDTAVANETKAPVKEAAASQTPQPQISKEAASTTSEIQGANYTVVKGDNLWKIAVRAYGDGYKWTQIAEANHLANPSIIHSGNVFLIPR